MAVCWTLFKEQETVKERNMNISVCFETLLLLQPINSWRIRSIWNTKNQYRLSACPDLLFVLFWPRILFKSATSDVCHWGVRPQRPSAHNPKLHTKNSNIQVQRCHTCTIKITANHKVLIVDTQEYKYKYRQLMTYIFYIFLRSEILYFDFTMGRLIPSQVGVSHSSELTLKRSAHQVL